MFDQAKLSHKTRLENCTMNRKAIGVKSIINISIPYCIWTRWYVFSSSQSASALHCRYLWINFFFEELHESLDMIRCFEKVPYATIPTRIMKIPSVFHIESPDWLHHLRVFWSSLSNHILINVFLAFLSHINMIIGQEFCYYFIRITSIEY